MRLRIVSLLAVAILTAPALARAEAAEGPRSLLITYRTAAPAARPAFRAYLASQEAAKLAEWKRQGVIQGFQILFNPFQSEETWDAMVVLRFAKFADTAKWIAIERASPGGLDADGLKLAHPVNTYAADADWEEGEDSARADEGAMFYVIPYEYRNEAEYRRYVDGYVIPQVKGWMQAGVLTGYRIFMNRYPVGKPWDALFVYRYKDLGAFGRRDATVAKVRSGLMSDPAWKAWSDNKAGLRTESENTIAEAVQGR